MLARTLTLVTLIAALAATAPAQESAATKPGLTIVHCGWLLAVPGEKPLENHTLIIRDGSRRSAPARRTRRSSPAATGRP
jgi:hypothetical protein